MGGAQVMSDAVAHVPSLLYVEDEWLVREVVQPALEDAGFTVISAATGKQALEVLLDLDQVLSGLITDIRLPGANGWDIARRARERYPRLPVIYLTADSENEWDSRGVPESILITKPFVPVQVVTALAQLLNASTS